MLATVTKLGGSVAIVIPKGMAAQNQLTPGTTVDLLQAEEGILIRKPRGRLRRPITEIVRAIDPAAYHRRWQGIAFDRPVGKEHWCVRKHTP
jgi:antitoxin component of MazEF toxin-antitoxin module